jgi:hypothetical protein
MSLAREASSGQPHLKDLVSPVAPEPRKDVSDSRFDNQHNGTNLSQSGPNALPCGHRRDWRRLPARLGLSGSATATPTRGSRQLDLLSRIVVLGAFSTTAGKPGSSTSPTPPQPGSPVRSLPSTAVSNLPDPTTARRAGVKLERWGRFERIWPLFPVELTLGNARSRRSSPQQCYRRSRKGSSVAATTCGSASSSVHLHRRNEQVLFRVMFGWSWCGSCWTNRVTRPGQFGPWPLRAGYIRPGSRASSWAALAIWDIGSTRR